MIETSEPHQAAKRGKETPRERRNKSNPEIHVSLSCLPPQQDRPPSPKSPSSFLCTPYVGIDIIRSHDLFRDERIQPIHLFPACLPPTDPINDPCSCLVRAQRKGGLRLALCLLAALDLSRVYKSRPAGSSPRFSQTKKTTHFTRLQKQPLHPTPHPYASSVTPLFRCSRGRERVTMIGRRDTSCAAHP